MINVFIITKALLIEESNKIKRSYYYDLSFVDLVAQSERTMVYFSDEELHTGNIMIHTQGGMEILKDIESITRFAINRYIIDKDDKWVATIISYNTGVKVRLNQWLIDMEKSVGVDIYGKAEYLK